MVKINYRRLKTANPANFKAVVACAIFLVALMISSLHSSSTSDKKDISAGNSKILHSSASAAEVDNTFSAMSKLSDVNTFFQTLEILYKKYGSEIASLRPKMRAWCEKTNSCKFCDYEVEMLYMLVRENKPQNVFEMAPNRGFSSHWILEALHKNDNSSRLHSFDIHEASVEHMDSKLQARWIFTLGDYGKLYDEGKLDMEKFDFIFIDALHEPEFARGYCKRLLSNHKRKAIVAIHDIVADANGGGRESEEVYKYLAFANNVKNTFTMSHYAMPNLLYSSQASQVVPMLNKLRADMGIVKPCDDLSCKKVMHDPLFFENNDSPTIFFQLNSDQVIY